MKLIKSNFSQEELQDSLRPFFKENKIKFVADRPGHDERYALNSSRIRREIKWKYKISVPQGLSKTIDWYSKNYNYFKKISRKNITKRLCLKV